MEVPEIMVSESGTVGYWREVLLMLTDNHPVLVLHGEQQVEVWQYYSKFTGAQDLCVTIGHCNPSQRSYEPRPTLIHSHPRIELHYLPPVDLPSHQTDTPDPLSETCFTCACHDHLRAWTPAPNNSSRKLTLDLCFDGTEESFDADVS